MGAPERSIIYPGVYDTLYIGHQHVLETLMALVASTVAGVRLTPWDRAACCRGSSCGRFTARSRVSAGLRRLSDVSPHRNSHKMPLLTLQPCSPPRSLYPVLVS